MPKNPEQLNDRRKQWASVILLELETAGMQNDINDHLVEQAAIAKVELDDLQRMVDHQGVIYTTSSRNGSTMRRTNPAYTELKDLRKAWLKLLMELGMTPMAAKRLGMVAHSSEFD